MGEMTFTIEQIANFVFKIITLIVSIGGASAVICKAISHFKKPNEKQNERISSLEKRVEKHDLMLAKDSSKLDKIEESSRITQQALLALLDHSLDGNNIRQLTDAKEALQMHLIGK